MAAARAACRIHTGPPAATVNGSSSRCSSSVTDEETQAGAEAQSPVQQQVAAAAVAAPATAAEAVAATEASPGTLQAQPMLTRARAKAAYAQTRSDQAMQQQAAALMVLADAATTVAADQIPSSIGVTRGVARMLGQCTVYALERFNARNSSSTGSSSSTFTCRISSTAARSSTLEFACMIIIHRLVQCCERLAGNACAATPAALHSQVQATCTISGC